MEDLDLISLLGNVLVEITPLVEEKKILLEQDFPPEPLHIHSSAGILESVFSDLLKNAIESAGDEGKVGLRVKLERAEGKQDYTLAQISDSGEGIGAQELALLFSPLMGESQVQAAQAGGVNFAEIKVRVESLNGKIWADSEPGKGTTFSLLLPTSAESTIEAPDKESEP
jgi:signal transduction histidine kinase